MDTALEHFANEGFHKTTISHIARHAGISKGLMYNYFESKEELLSEIIRRSVSEVYEDFDPDRDGFLTPDEFELYIRKLSSVIRNKRQIWMLFLQMMMQKEVREIFLEESFSGKAENIPGIRDDIRFIPQVYSMICDYFNRKAEGVPEESDPETEANMFIITLKGFAVTWIFSDNDDDELFNKTVNKIIEQYK
jgi:AcrR family transcriptional regulator